MPTKELEQKKYRKQMHKQKHTKLLAEIQTALNVTHQQSYLWFVTMVLNDMRDYLLEEERYDE